MKRPVIVDLALPVLFLAALFALFVYEPHDDIPRTFYRLIGLFLHDSAWIFEPDKGSKVRLTRWLAVLVPVVSAAAFISLVINSVRPWRLRFAARLRLLTGAKCVALVGLSEQSLALAVSMHADRTHRTLPIIMAENGDTGLLSRCQLYGVAVFPRYRRDYFSWLHLVGRRPRSVLPLNTLINRAWDVVSFLPTAGMQLDFVSELKRWHPRKRDRDPRAWILLDDRGLAQRLEDHVERLMTTDKPSLSVVPRLLTLTMLRARHLLTLRQFDTLADAFGQSQIHLAIYGFGATGRAIVKEAAQLYVTRPSLAGTKLRVTFFDKDPVAAEAALLAEDPGISTIVQLTGNLASFASAGLLEPQVGLLPADVTGHIIAFGDSASAFNLAVSLRRWLLEPPPPPPVNSAQAYHHAAPIFVSTSSWRGIGQLFCKRLDVPRHDSSAHRAIANLASRLARMLRLASPDQPTFPVPDGIFGYGAIEDLFGAAEGGLAPIAGLLDEESERGAQALHFEYGYSRLGNAGAPDFGKQRAAEKAWADLSSSLRESNFRAFDHIAIKARAIGWRFVPSAAGQTAARFDAKARTDLAEIEHRRYMAERIANGWRWAPQRLDAVRVHPDLVEWDLLTAAEQRLDAKQVVGLPVVAGAAGRRLAPALVVGVVGHRPNKLPPGPAQDTVKRLISARLSRLRAENPERELLVLTALAQGTDSLAASAAWDLEIPFVAVFPLPYELYREDFSERRALPRFHELAALAELHVELPLRFGRASELTTSGQPKLGSNVARRSRQYALGGAYIVERAHELIAVYDGGPGDGVGGTAEILSWWPGGVPDDYATPSNFFVRPPPTGRPEAYVIRPMPVDETGKPDAGDL